MNDNSSYVVIRSVRMEVYNGMKVTRYTADLPENERLVGMLRLFGIGSEIL